MVRGEKIARGRQIFQRGGGRRLVEKVRWTGALFIGKSRAAERTALEVRGQSFERVVGIKVREGERRREKLFLWFCGGKV